MFNSKNQFSYLNNNKVRIIMGNKQSHKVADFSKDSFKIERILDSNKNIIVGITSVGEGIRIGNGPVKYLKFTYEEDKKIQYEFADFTHLIIENRDGIVYLSLNEYTTVINQLIIKLWKPIECSSPNLDRIQNIFYPVVGIRQAFS
jgi:hypothetical protein